MNDDRRPGRHSLDGPASAPRWPIGDRDRPSGPRWPGTNEPRWPTASEAGWENPPTARRQPPRRLDPRRPDAARRSQYGAGFPDPDAAVTDMLPPIQEEDYELSPRREPPLLTHTHPAGQASQDPEAKRRINALVADSDGDGGGEGEDALHAIPPGNRRRRKIRRALYAFVAIFIILPLVAFTLAYFVVDVPSPNEVAAGQGKTVTYYYSDGKTVMGQDFSDGNREMLQPEDIPDTVKHAVYAAEDETFETNSGFDVSGILRAVKNQLTGGTGGGSTITQQYIKKATENEERTITRKALEIVKAFKMNNEVPKSRIITAYLNTIYFGRGAYGIQAAAKAYFGKPANDLTTEQAAYLAGIIQQPSRGDDADYAETRWNYVMGQLVANKWLSSSERADAEFPETIPPDKGMARGFSGPNRHIKDRVDEELEKLDFSANEVRLNGYRVYTTIDRRAQGIAEDVVKDVMKGEPKKLKEAMAAVDPSSGAVRAYYGGPYNEKDQRDWANTMRNPGSTMKVFDFTALLKIGDKGPYARYDGTSPRNFEGVEEPIYNSSDDQCPNCTVMEAMKRSVNTVFYDMVANDVKPAAVIDAARDAGVTNSSELDKSTNIAIGGGNTKLTPRDMATAFATYAADGIRHESHFVDKITTPDGEIVYQRKSQGEPAFDEDRELTKQIAGNVTMTLEAVPGYSNRACPASHPCAGKTGTHEHTPGDDEPDLSDNSEAWMAGYTKHIAAAAWVGTGSNQPIRNMYGAKIFGSGLPGAIWERFMDRYHEGLDPIPFSEVELIGEKPPPPPPPEPVVTEAPEPEETTTEPTKPSKPEDKPGNGPKPSETTEPPETTTPPDTCFPGTCPGRPDDPEPTDD